MLVNYDTTMNKNFNYCTRFRLNIRLRKNNNTNNIGSLRFLSYSKTVLEI